MAIDDVYLLTTSATQAGTIRQNTLAFIATTADDPDGTEFLAIANAFKVIHQASQHTSVTYTTYKARQIRGSGVTWPDTGTACVPTGGLFFDGNLTGSLVGGTGGSDYLPPQCAMVTTLRSGQIGRSHRGRCYSYGFPEISTTGGQWNTDMLLVVEAGWTAFFTAYAVAVPTSGYRLGIWSTRIASGCRVLANGDHERTGPAQPELAFTPATGHVTRQTIYTQRRRVSGVGA